MTFGNSKAALEARKVLRDGDSVISERAYNLIIGGMLLWGFLCNWLIVTFWSDGIMRYAYNGGAGVIYLLYFIFAILGVILVNRPNAVASFIGYNLIVVPIGVLLCIALDGVDAQIISTAVLFTGLITLVYLILGTVFPDFFLSIGRTLLGGLGILLIGSLITAIFGFGDYLLCWLGAGLFGLFIGFDWARCNVCACTLDNAVDAAANLYLDIINLFLRLVRILNESKRR